MTKAENSCDNLSRLSSKSTMESDWFPLATVKNPQANDICDRVVHQTVGNTLRTMLLVNSPNNLYDTNGLIYSVLVATAMDATRASSNCSLLNHTPGALASLHRDMMMDIPLIAADLITMRNSRPVIIDEKLCIANLERQFHLD
jgi:hypothetical protein